MEIIVGSEKEVFMPRILSIDPSGTGTTGFCLIENDSYLFFEFQNKDWKEHLFFLKDLLIKETPDFLLYENTHYLHTKTQDSLNLFRLLGGLEGLPVKTEHILVNQVKDLKSKLFKKSRQIPNLEFKFGQGWFYSSQRISLHQLDAFLVYWLWKEAHA